MQLVRDLVDHENSLWLNYTAGAPVRKLTPEHEADLRAFYTAFSTFNRDVMDAYAGAKNAAGGASVFSTTAAGPMSQLPVLRCRVNVCLVRPSRDRELPNRRWFSSGSRLREPQRTR